MSLAAGTKVKHVKFRGKYFPNRHIHEPIQKLHCKICKTCRKVLEYGQQTTSSV